MADVDPLLTVGDRVRINEEDDPWEHVGQMGIVQDVQLASAGERTCVVRLDRYPDSFTFPERFVGKVETRPSSLLANDLFLPWDMDNPQSRIGAFTRIPAHVLGVA